MNSGVERRALKGTVTNEVIWVGIIRGEEGRIAKGRWRRKRRKARRAVR